MSRIPKDGKKISLSPIYRTPVLMVGSVICQKPEEVMTKVLGSTPEDLDAAGVPPLFSSRKSGC